MFQTIISNIQGKIKDVVNRAPALFCKLNGTPCATRSPLYDAITKPEWFTLYTIFYWVMAIAICLIICLDVEDRGYYVFVAVAAVSAAFLFDRAIEIFVGLSADEYHHHS